MTRRYVPLAEVARPHGVQGELRLKIYNEESDLLLRRPDVRLRLASGELRDTRIETARSVNKALLVRLPGVADRDAAEALRGAVIEVPRDAFPPLDEGEFYACDIEGASAVLEGQGEIGRVLELRSYPTCDVLVVDRGEAGTLEIPLLEAYVSAVEPDHGVVRLVSIDGLV
jgi:16S rRNA processing protein RimM